uniref:Uncharacterized protein n=1 Tax=Anguilla anguilla TaxID=7936 RepID=A0A0E9UP61_ANGAN
MWSSLPPVLTVLNSPQHLLPHSLLRLPRCLYPMKYNLLYRIPNFSHSRSPIPIYPMRSIYC